MNKYFAELIGTFFLVFFGTGAILINEEFHGIIGHVGIALAFGTVVTILIYSLQNDSGAHLNPAVTIGLAIRQKQKPIELILYILSQLIGATAASFSLKYLFPNATNLGNTIPQNSDIQSLILEFIMTFFLMFVILKLSSNSKKTQILNGLIIGFVIFLEALVGGPISCASMNPARSIAPALASFNFQSLYIYIIAPIFGAALASLTAKKN